MSTQNGNRVVDVNFNCYFNKPNQAPEKSGIYAICRGKQENDGWRFSELLYIGEANNINERLNGNHEKKIPCAINAFLNKEKLMYFVALIPNHDNRELAEKVLIWKMKPKFNDRFDYPVADEPVTVITKSPLGIPSVIKIPVLDD